MSPHKRSRRRLKRLIFRMALVGIGAILFGLTIALLLSFSTAARKRTVPMP